MSKSRSGILESSAISRFSDKPAWRKAPSSISPLIPEKQSR
jgi:hypothetical protein